ncbi:hypothetical protein HPB58_12880 [Priestia filamentosa]|uniref:hypothetical protein n=1 Tax=Priestia filamentosa TaxID=1402861 RepID=UPI001FB392A1|nr:hypothetical protein [Priestia filamentosa]UOE63007.1 hypothetical protein HPB58_12880 [Priestia filamentosa]
MNNSEKARKLYEECDGTNPERNTLMPSKYMHDNNYDIYAELFIGIVVNYYATKEFENDLVPISKEDLFIRSDDKEGWTNMKRAIYKLKKKSLIEVIEKENKKFARILVDDFYDPELYRRQNIDDRIETIK